ncbi:hypothetical protein [Terrimonas pollutisoli]|uniref:hypothetical protein n=1 Tax=Terrimonas pollutisoli TaxID=3034147 RepID=UPI0023EBB209|nr:hypothetical protein [Terrimonas sp. H1YJ31]
MAYRKLSVKLPRQPLINQRPWLIVGLLLALIFLLATAYAYFNYKYKSANALPDIHNASLNQPEKPANQKLTT